MTSGESSDPMFDAILQAVTKGRESDVAQARTDLVALWQTIGCDGDPFHRCTLAHYLADLYGDPAVALTWDVRALDAAEAISANRVLHQEADLRVAGFYPSLHLNLADNYRRLGSFDAAAEHIEAAREQVSVLGDDAYGDLIRGAITEVAGAIANRDTVVRASAPAP